MTALPSSTIKIDETLRVQAKEHKGEKIEWEERKTCYISKARQGGELWRQLRLCAMQMSKLAKCLRRVPIRFQDHPDQLGGQLCGTIVEEFDEESRQRMSIGTTGEPILRDWDAKRRGVNIKEVGVAVWKADPRFRASLDGEIDEKTFVEYKITKRLYQQLIEHMEAIKKGFKPPPNYHAHIFDSHHIQMTSSGVITDKKECGYSVMCLESTRVYTESIPINYEYWNNTLYPEADLFLRQHVEPIMRQRGLRRIDP